MSIKTARSAKPATNTPGLERSNELVETHLYLVQHAVNQVSTRYPRHVDREELWNAGAYGLVDASRRYDETMGIPFARYAMIRIRGAIIDSTRSRDWATRAMRRGMREVRDATEVFERENHREPTAVELSTALNITVEQLDAYRTAAVSSSLLHLDQRVGGGESEDTTLGELIEEKDSERLPEDQIEHRELTGTLRTAVRHLPEVQREVVERYYFQGEFLRSIADSMGVTEARVSQIRSEALNAVRAYFADSFEGIPQVDERAPGRRSRAAFVARLAEESSWRTRLDAADRALVPESRTA